jgi:hypothetical protein
MAMRATRRARLWQKLLKSAQGTPHPIIACLPHDIGYVRGIFVQDDEKDVLIDAAGRKVKLPRGSSDAALLAHHVGGPQK